MKIMISGILKMALMIGVLCAVGQAQNRTNTGYWKYDSQSITPTAEELAAVKPLPGHVYETRATGGLQAGPGDGKGSVELFFKTDDADRVQFLATSTLTFGADTNLVTLLPGQKLMFDVGLAVGGNDKSRAMPATGRGTVAIDNGNNIVDVTTKLGQTASGKGVATIPGGGEGSTMEINVGSYLAHLGALAANLHIRYVWVAGTPPTPKPGLPNLALNRPAKQSSTSEWSKPNDAQGAVDGVKNGSYGFHTNNEKNPWWQVDLGEVKQLAQIRIFNRLDYNPERARTIQVLLSKDGINWTRVFANNGSIFGGSDGKPLVVPITGISGRYVRLQLAETNWFHLDEVEIY